jgi:vacuolar-type H+-ATPase subunit B/Vma2
MIDHCKGRFVEEELDRVWRIFLRVDEKELKQIEKQIIEIGKLAAEKRENMNVDIELIQL